MPIINVYVFFYFPRLHAKIKESMEETLNTTETNVSEAEAWVEPSTLSQELEQANVEMQKSMVIPYLFINVFILKLFYPDNSIQ